MNKAKKTYNSKYLAIHANKCRFTDSLGIDYHWCGNGAGGTPNVELQFAVDTGALTGAVFMPEGAKMSEMGAPYKEVIEQAAVDALRREFDTSILQKEDFRRIAELLTEFRWMQACFTSFLLQGSKEYKVHKAKTDEIGRLREKCENEAMR